MPRSKKYDAAEKHFLQREQQLNRKMKERGEAYTELVKQLKVVKDDLSRVEAENAQLRDWVDRLLEYTELSKEDIKQACEKDKEIRSPFKAFIQMAGMLH